MHGSRFFVYLFIFSTTTLFLLFPLHAGLARVGGVQRDEQLRQRRARGVVGDVLESDSHQGFRTRLSHQQRLQGTKDAPGKCEASQPRHCASACSCE